MVCINCSCTNNVRLLWDQNLILPQSSKLLGWILLDVIHHIFVARYLTKHGGLLVEKSLTIKSAKALKVKSQIMH